MTGPDAEMSVDIDGDGKNDLELKVDDGKLVSAKWLNTLKWAAPIGIVAGTIIMAALWKLGYI